MEVVALVENAQGDTTVATQVVGLVAMVEAQPVVVAISGAALVMVTRVEAEATAVVAREASVWVGLRVGLRVGMKVVVMIAAAEAIVSMMTETEEVALVAPQAAVEDVLGQ
jgi:hypothetical protein